ncbi:unnamed protein product [Effrenium voratum]|nr:unnamed protein product [Effrenium voratum]
MGNVSDHVSTCNEECQVRAEEYIRHGQLHMEKVMNDDRRRLDKDKDPRERPRSSRPGRERKSEKRPKVSWASDNPMREYRPKEAASERAQGPGVPSQERVPPPAPALGPGFDPWAPEGVYARRRREEARQKQKEGNRASASRRAEEGPRNEDTQIGTSISEFLRRGVAQASEKPPTERPEMMPSKDGGFIATIQQGFQGIFGHLATSKEEVLKMRGPMPAIEYEAVPGDDIDQRVQFFARQIPEHLGEWLKIYRKARGEYEVSDEFVRMAWQSTVEPPTSEHPGGQIVREVFVYVDAEPAEGGAVPGEPLHLFLRHSANVAYDLHFGSALTKVPEQSRLSFADETGTLLKDSDADSKYKAMLLASEQAQKREQAALEFRKKMDDEAAHGGSPKHSPRHTPRAAAQSAPTVAESARPQTARSERSESRGMEGPLLKERSLPPPQGLDDLLAVLPPLPPLLPPALPGPGGSFLLPPGADLEGMGYLMPKSHQNSFAGHAFAPSGGVTRLQSLAMPGSFYSAGLGPQGGSFLGGSFLMHNAWNLPRTGSNVQVGMPPLTVPMS